MSELFRTPPIIIDLDLDDTGITAADLDEQHRAAFHRKNYWHYGRLYQVWYRTTQMGKARDARYEASPKGKARRTRYEQSEKGKATRKKYRKTQKEGR